MIPVFTSDDMGLSPSKEGSQSGERSAVHLLKVRVAQYLLAGKLLARHELSLIYHERHLLKPTRDQLKLVLVSMWKEAPVGVETSNCALGWFWFRKLSRFEFAGIVVELTSDRRPFIRMCAARVLGFLASKVSFKAILRLIDDPVGDVAGEAAKALGRYPADQAVPVLRRAAVNTSIPWLPRRHAMEAITRFGRAGHAAVVIKLLKDPSPSIRSSALRVLHNLPCSVDATLLLKLAKDPSPQVRRDAVRVMGNRHQAAHHDFLVQVATGVGCRPRSSAVEALAHYRNNADLPLLRKLATDADCVVRWRAAEGLGLFQVTSDIPFLRAMAVKNQLGSLDSLLRFSPALIVATLRAFAKHGNLVLRSNLALQLGEWPHPEASTLLRKLAQDGDPIVRSSAVSSLGALGDPRHLPLLRKSIEDKSDDVRRETVWALGQIVQAKEIALLKDCLHDPVVEVRTLAARMLSLVLPRSELRRWFAANYRSLNFDELKEIDYRLYAPDWLQRAEMLDEDDYNLMHLGVHRHCRMEQRRQHERTHPKH